ncbi:UbiD family decarboxylase [Paenibacillus sp. MMS20-IR301]|uniref:UbiD family decarboxylase n=1 Tax=Paenibacillus sp. MMS20-IR301 TaxID=2895946 RepID=UPI0028E49586|nr:UbiD family decarboxylase [Paenibacillus sp. MMS20-IR301]WNS43253.1 UbiD family decarboxylase [Paenibacillus sp. MMS20-IR301]
MAYGNLRQWIEQLRRDKDLAVIDTPVDPNLELAEIHRRVVEEEGPALLFTNVLGTPFPVASNLFGTVRRVNKAFGTRPEQLMKSMTTAVEAMLPPSASGLWREKGVLFDLLKAGTKNVPQGEAPVLGLCRSNDPLKELPRITSWPKDGGPFITLPLVYTESITNPKDHNLGMYRVQIHDDSTTGIHWQIHKGGGFHHRQAELLGETLPLSVFIGGPPALIAAAVAPVPERLPELMLASLMLGSKLPMVQDPLGGHRIPAEAEFSLRGRVSPFERRPEGPYGSQLGYYSQQHDFPVMHVQRMWHRKDAIFPATITGKPRQEDYYLKDYLQRLLAPAYPLLMPSVKALWAYSETGSHSLTAAVVRESYSREAVAAAFRILGEGQLSLTKFLFLTSEQVELTDFPKLLETVLERFKPESDLLILANTSMDTLDYTGPRLNHGSKAVVLGIGNPVRELPRTYTGGLLPAITAAVPYCGGCLAVSGASYEEDAELPARLVASFEEKPADWPLIVLVDDAEAAVRTQTSFLWSVFTRFNPADDIYAGMKVRRNTVSYSLPVVIDARMKRGYPEELVPLEDTVELVNRNWKHYFPLV